MNSNLAPQSHGPAMLTQYLNIEAQPNLTPQIHGAALIVRKKITGESSNVPMKIELDKVEREKCKTIWNTIQYNIYDSEICYNPRNKDENVCDGDSGGPLIGKFNKTWYCYGLISFGPQCGNTAEFPGVYTNVYAFIDWILENIQSSAGDITSIKDTNI